MPIIGSARSFFRKFSFVLEIEGLGRVGFRQMCELLTLDAATLREEGVEPGDLVVALEHVLFSENEPIFEDRERLLRGGEHLFELGSPLIAREQSIALVVELLGEQLGLEVHRGVGRCGVVDLLGR